MSRILVRCASCDVPFFAKDRRTKYCTSDCRKAELRRRVAAKPPPSWIHRRGSRNKPLTREARDLQNQRMRRAYAAVKAIIADYKAERGCADCGDEEDPDALQFDHVSGEKTGNIAEVTTWSDLEWFKVEAKKCEVVCANCHAKRTRNRRKLYGAGQSWRKRSGGTKEGNGCST